MTTHDIYLLSPEISIAGLAMVLVLLDLVVSRKEALTFVAFVGLAAPLALSIVLWADLNDQASLEMSADFGTETVTFVVDKFSLFFKFLLVAVAGVVVLASAEYADRFQRYRGEFYALLLLSTSGMMLLASTVELISIYVSLELTALPIAALAAFMRDGRSSESRHEVPHPERNQLSRDAVRDGHHIRLHRRHRPGRHRKPNRSLGPGCGHTIWRKRAAVRRYPRNGGLRVQDSQRPVPDVGARRVRGLPYPGHCVPVRRLQSGRVRRHFAGLLHRLRVRNSKSGLERGVRCY